MKTYDDFHLAADLDISKAFRQEFLEHPARKSDPALALQSARETASKLARQLGVTGFFDDETLEFFCDEELDETTESRA